MATEEERDNFFRLTLLLFRNGSQRLREYFKIQWLIVYQRVKPGTVPPPWQDTPADATQMKNIQPTKLKFKFKDEETKFDSGNTNDWDFSLLTTVLRYSSLHFVLPGSPEHKALGDLKDIRVMFIARATDAAIPNGVFNIAWTKACNALKLFNATEDDFKAVQDDVKKPLDVLYAMLKQCIRQEKEIQDAVDTIFRKLEQLQQGQERILQGQVSLQQGQERILQGQAYLQQGQNTMDIIQAIQSKNDTTPDIHTEPEDTPDIHTEPEDTPDIHTEPEDTPDIHTEPEDTVFEIDETGGSYSVLRRGIFLEVPPNAVSKPAKITCKVQPNDCSRTLAGDEETLVSYIVELGPKDMEIIQPITVTLVHSGPSRDLGYDTVVKAFNQEKNDWEEIEELRNRSKYSESDYIQVKISKMTKLAVVSRLVTDRFEVTPNKKCVVTSSVCDDITLEFPQGTVDKTVEGTMKVILVDKNYFYNKYNLYPCPILCVNGFKGISFQKSPMIRLPRPCKETHPGSKTSLFCLEDAKKSDGNEMSWEDITDKVDIKEDEAFVFVELHVRHFSWYSTFTGESRPSRSHISSFFDYFSQIPRNVYFAAFKNNEDPYKSFRLKLMCVENSNEELKTKDLTGYKKLMGKTGPKAMRIGDEAYVKIEGDFKKDETNTGSGFLRFLGNEGYYEEFYVCKNNQTVMKGNEDILILFHTENQEHDLCTLYYKIQQPSAGPLPPERPSADIPGSHNGSQDSPGHINLSHCGNCKIL